MSAKIALLVMTSAFGALFAHIAYQEARSEHPDVPYASRAQRVILWLVALGFVAGGLLGLIDEESGFIVWALLVLLGVASQAVLWLSLIVAPRWAARVWYHQQLIALGHWTGKTVPTLAEAERAARRAGYGILVLVALIWLGYWLTTRWLGIFILPLIYGIALSIGIAMVYRHQRFFVRRLRSTIRSSQ